MRTGKLSEVIADLQMLQKQIGGDAPVQLALQHDGRICAIPMGGMTIYQAVGGKHDGQECVIICGVDLQPIFEAKTREHGGEVIK